jgi:hypothetical protein
VARVQFTGLGNDGDQYRMGYPHAQLCTGCLARLDTCQGPVKRSSTARQRERTRGSQHTPQVDG